MQLLLPYSSYRPRNRRPGAEAPASKRPSDGFAPAFHYPGAFYFSGAGQRRDVAVLDAERARGMVSAARLLASPGLRRTLDAYDLPLALDSGAFTNGRSGKRAVTLSDYTALLRTYAERFDFCVTLDVMGRPRQSDRNFLTLRDAGFPVVYVYQAGDRRPLAEAARHALDAGDTMIAVGGLVKHLASLRARKPGHDDWTGEAECVNWLTALGHHAHALGVKLHLLGVGSLPVLRCISAERWFASADCSAWVMASAKGRQITSTPFAYGRQLGAGDPYCHLIEGSTWEARAAGSIRATLDACTHKTRVTGPFCVDDDRDYFERVELARRFGCEDDTESMAFLADVLDYPDAYDPDLDGYYVDDAGGITWADDPYGWSSDLPRDERDGFADRDDPLPTYRQAA